MPVINLQDVRIRPDKWQGMSHSKLLSLYGQDKYWIDVFGEKIYLCDMDSDYLWNVIKLLKHTAPLNVFKASWAMMRFVEQMGEQTQLDWEQWDAEWAHWEFNPWDMPLARGIAVELAKRADYGDPHWWSPVYTEAEIKKFREGGAKWTF